MDQPRATISTETYRNISKMCKPETTSEPLACVVGSLEGVYHEKLGLGVPVQLRQAAYCLFDSLAGLQTRVLADYACYNTTLRFAALLPMVHTRDLGVVHSVLPIAGYHKRGDTGARAVLLVTCSSASTGVRDTVALFVDLESGTDPEYFSQDPRMLTGLLSHNSSVRNALGLTHTAAAVFGSVRAVSSSGRRTYTMSNTGDIDGKHSAFFIATWKPNYRQPEWTHSLMWMSTANRSFFDNHRDVQVGRIISQSEPDTPKTHATCNRHWAIRKVCDL